MGDLCINLFHENSIGTIIKHVPGHGLAKVDSHNFTPIVNQSIKHLKKYDFSAFKNKKCFIINCIFQLCTFSKRIPLIILSFYDDYSVLYR